MRQSGWTASLLAVTLAAVLAGLVAQPADETVAAEPTPTPTPVFIPGVATAAADARPLPVDAKVPAVSLTRADGTAVDLLTLSAQGPMVVVFYRGGWCPYCNTQLAALHDLEPRLRAAGYRLVAVSMDSPEAIGRWKQEHTVAFEILSDSKAELVTAFGLAYKVSGTEFTRLKSLGIDLEEASGQSHHILPVPAVYIISDEGHVRWRFFAPDYRTRLKSEELMKAIERP